MLENIQINTHSHNSSSNTHTLILFRKLFHPLLFSLPLSVFINSGSSQPALIYCWPLFSQGSDRVCYHFNLSLVKFYFPCHCDCVSVSGINIENSDWHADRWIAVTVPTSVKTFPLFLGEPAFWGTFHFNDEANLLQKQLDTYSQIV